MDSIVFCYQIKMALKSGKDYHKKKHRIDIWGKKRRVATDITRCILKTMTVYKKMDACRDFTKVLCCLSNGGIVADYE